MGNFTGKTAIVTGASRGIGLAIAGRLAREGASIAVISTKPEIAAATGESLAAEYGIKAKGYGCDVSDFKTVQDVFAGIIADFGTVDILVNNAGITRDGLLPRMSEEDWDNVLDTNLKGAFNTCKAVLRPMMRARSGRIVNISSVVGIMGNPGQTNYGAAKAGLIGFSKSLAKEIASRNITVNVVAPGFIDTDMSAAMPEAAREAILGSIPLSRTGKTSDIAGAVAFLAGPDAEYITGHVICVDGGLCI